MQCPKCGIETQDNQKYCTNCGYDLSQKIEIKEDNIVNQKDSKGELIYEEVSEEYKNKADRLILLNIFFFLTPIVIRIFKLFETETSIRISIFSILGGIITIVTARIKYKKISYVRNLFLVEIILYGLLIFLILFLMITCYNTIKDCGDLG